MKKILLAISGAAAVALVVPSTEWISVEKGIAFALSFVFLYFLFRYICSFFEKSNSIKEMQMKDYAEKMEQLRVTLENIGANIKETVTSETHAICDNIDGKALDAQKTIIDFGGRFEKVASSIAGMEESLQEYQSEYKKNIEFFEKKILEKADIIKADFDNCCGKMLTTINGIIPAFASSVSQLEKGFSIGVDRVCQSVDSVSQKYEVAVQTASDNFEAIRASVDNCQKQIAIVGDKMESSFISATTQFKTGFSTETSRICQTIDVLTQKYDEISQVTSNDFMIIKETINNCNEKLNDVSGNVSSKLEEVKRSLDILPEEYSKTTETLQSIINGCTNKINKLSEMYSEEMEKNIQFISETFSEFSRNVQTTLEDSYEKLSDSLDEVSESIKDAEKKLSRNVEDAVSEYHDGFLQLMDETTKKMQEIVGNQMDVIRKARNLDGNESQIMTRLENICKKMK